MSTVPVTDRLSTLHYTVHSEPHIVVDGAKCRDCDAHPCLNFCPAGCFSRADTGNSLGGIAYYYVGCVECGTCLLVCGRDAVRWNYPAGGHGVSYRF